MRTTNPTQHVPLLDQLLELLDEVVVKQAGHRVAELTRRVRSLAVERRAGMPEAERRLVNELNQLDLAEAHDVIRAFTMYLDLANLAEDLNRICTLHRQSRTAEGARERRSETIHDAIATLKQRGLSAVHVQTLLRRLRIEPVFTAHPSEAKRRTTRQILRRLRLSLNTIARTDVGPDLRPLLFERMRADLTAMWQSDLLRPHRPSVLSEIERGLFFANGLWDVIPQISRDLRRALAVHYPDFRFELPAVLRFGTWIGGDRDGHPFVTTETTAQTLETLRAAAVENHLKQCRELMGVVVMSERHTLDLSPLKDAVRKAVEKMPGIAAALGEISESEIGRKWLKVIEQRLLATSAGDAEAAYTAAEDLQQDVSLLVESLTACGSRDVVEMYVQPWLDNVRCFGLHFAALDIRQHSGVHTAMIAEVLKLAGLHEDYAAADDAARTAILVEMLSKPVRVDEQHCSAPTREMLALFRLLARTVRQEGLSRLGGYVISMTHQVSDALAVLWLWNHAWREIETSAELPLLPVVPLFETIQDLTNAADIMESLWSQPVYRDYLQQCEDRSQMVMIGYSDSTKDGGYLAATWELHQAQCRLAALAERHGIRLIVFHGRGGALGRGGGPAARTVLSLPPDAVNGAMRVTEQGEILAERYDDPEIAFRHLEQVTWATLLVSGSDSSHVAEDYVEEATSLANESLAEYRRLVAHPAFLNYFESATPVAEIENLPIGSRPARRAERRSLADLRAIPWMFAWTQSRHLVPAWYGLGTAIRRFVDDRNGDWSRLHEMYERWPFFSATIDNAELALAKTDIEIAHSYRALCEAPEAEQVWGMIYAEYVRSRGTILLLKQQDELLDDTAWLQRSIRVRNPSVDPLNLLQIRLLRESRTAEDAGGDNYDPESLASHVLRLTIHGIAAGLRTTG